MRLFAFVVALLLLAGSIDPTRGWLIALVVVTGVSAIRPRFWNWFHVSPALDLRLAAFVLALLLLAGTVEPTREWLIALSVVTGMAMVMPGAFGLERLGFGHDDHGQRRRMDRWSARADRDWDRWGRRMDRRRARRTDEWGDDWS